MGFCADVVEVSAIVWIHLATSRSPTGAAEERNMGSFQRDVSKPWRGTCSLLGLTMYWDYKGWVGQCCCFWGFCILIGRERCHQEWLQWGPEGTMDGLDPSCTSTEEEWPWAFLLGFLGCFLFLFYLGFQPYVFSSSKYYWAPTAYWALC